MNEHGDSSGSILAACGWRVPAAAFVWWVLTEGEGGWMLAAPAVLLSVGASLALAPPSRSLRISPGGLLRFCTMFVRRSVVAGLQVARFAFSPRPALRPATRAVDTTLPPGLPRVLLANTLTLQPGTLSVAVEGDRLQVHVLDDDQPLEPEVRALEARIAALLGLDS